MSQSKEEVSDEEDNDDGTNHVLHITPSVTRHLAGSQLCPTPLVNFIDIIYRGLHIHSRKKILGFD